MPYYHVRCGGEIRWYPPFPIPPKCKRCGRVWSPLVMYGPPRKDMNFLVSLPELKKGKTTYAKWADKFPGAGTMASRLPNWPRWARMLTALVLVLAVGFLIYWGLT